MAFVLFDFSSFKATAFTLSLWTMLVITLLLLWRVTLGRSRLRAPRSRAGLEVALAERDPQNVVPFLPDEELESRRLERVLFGAFVMAVIMTVALFVYFLREPVRTNAATEKFDDESVERGEVLYANDTMDAYNSTLSLACANCHGAKGEGGTAAFVINPVEEGEDPVRVNWKAPALDSVVLRYPSDEAKIQEGRPLETQVAQIIIYGRPGTPMPAWGVAGGGAKNDQAIADLVNYLYTIQIGNADAQERAAALARESKDQPAQLVEEKQAALDDAEQTLADLRADPDAEAAAITAAEAAVAAAREELADAQRWQAERADVTEGQILFENNCARCHTKGWSYFDPADPYALPEWTGPVRGPDGTIMQGTGAFGPELRNGRSLLQFPAEETQTEFVQNGSQFQKPYGVNGIGSGRMPGFVNVLTEEQIQAIIEYERKL